MDNENYTFNALAFEIHNWARGKGFYEREYFVVPAPRGGDIRIENVSLPMEKMMLIASEVSEAADAHRDGDFQHEGEEIADIIIRALDFAAWRGHDMNYHIKAKMDKNRKRPHRHGRRF